MAMSGAGWLPGINCKLSRSAVCRSFSEIKSVLAQDQIFGRESVSDMAVRSQAIAAVKRVVFCI